MIKLHIYSKSTGKYKYTDTGPEDHVFIDMPEGTDFTLTPPPNTYEQWRWVDEKWTTDDTAN